MRSLAWALIQDDGCPYKTGSSVGTGTDTHSVKTSRERPCEGGWSEAPWDRVSLTPSKEPMGLPLGLLASKTVRQYISILSDRGHGSWFWLPQDANLGTGWWLQCPLLGGSIRPQP